MFALRGGSLAVAMTLLAATATCTSEDDPPADVGPGRDGGPADADAEDVVADPEADQGPGRPRPGPLTNVVTLAELLEDRICDIDGDGVADNAIANLGSPNSSVFAITINALMQGTIEATGVGAEAPYRLVFHMPWVDDLGGPNDLDPVAIVFEGVDTDFPPDPTDDYSGDEPFYAGWNALDGCGEPLHVMGRASIAAGAFTGEDVTVPFFMGRPSVWGHVVRVTGTVAAGGRSMELVACGYDTIQQLGGSQLEGIGRSLTVLEAMVAGGAAMGYPTIPGLTPDLDLDRDGLERFVLDENYYIETCIDGDGALIPGRSCWLDPTMADGFSIVMRMASTSARFAEREPGWQEYLAAAGRSCPEPPAQSLWVPR